jgi:hypothetical protein
MKTGSLLVVIVVSAVVFGACNITPVPATCSDIPDGGCPTDNGATVCADLTCDSVYQCNNGSWVFVQQCPPHPHDDAGAPLEAGSMEASIPDVHIDYDLPPGANPYGDTPACTDLEMPDCSLSAAAACAATPDCCGCQDVWICESSGWTIWGSCGDAGLMPNMK